MNDFVFTLPKLTLPNITIFSTFLKLIEELGEANTELNKLEEFEKQNVINVVQLSDKELRKLRSEFKVLLTDSLKEMVDITQVCVSLMFVFEETKRINHETIKSVLFEHLKEIKSNYAVSSLDEFYIIEKDGFKYMNLPMIYGEMNLLDALSQITIACGSYAQLIGKYSKLNGEENLQKEIDEDEIDILCLKNIIKIAQVSLDVLRHMSIKYDINLEIIFQEHITKLKKRGYLK
jgi:hypothetical protein